MVESQAVPLLLVSERIPVPLHRGNVKYGTRNTKRRSCSDEASAKRPSLDRKLVT
jgi:hypothetical protein